MDHRTSLLLTLFAIGCFGLTEETSPEPDPSPDVGSGGGQLEEDPAVTGGSSSTGGSSAGGSIQPPEPSEGGQGGALCESFIDVVVPAKGCVFIRCHESEWRMVYNDSDEDNPMGIRADESMPCEINQ